MKRPLIVLACAFVAFAPAPQEEPLFPDGFDKLDDVAKRAWEKGVDAATKELKDEAAKHTGKGPDVKGGKGGKPK